MELISKNGTLKQHIGPHCQTGWMEVWRQAVSEWVEERSRMRSSVVVEVGGAPVASSSSCPCNDEHTETSDQPKLKLETSSGRNAMNE